MHKSIKKVISRFKDWKKSLGDEGDQVDEIRNFVMAREELFQVMLFVEDAVRKENNKVINTCERIVEDNGCGKLECFGCGLLGMCEGKDKVELASKLLAELKRENEK